MHVQDISHPNAEAQKADVLSVLKKLNLRQPLIDNIVEARNKIDAWLVCSLLLKNN